MNLHSTFNCECDFDGSGLCADFSVGYEEATQQRALRKKLEDRLDQKRLLEELGELDSVFDWNEIDH